MSVTTSSTSSMAQLTWALRRYGWLFALALVAGVAGGSAAYSAQKPVYESEALIVAQQLSLDAKALPGYADAVFSGGAVARAVGADPGLQIDPDTLGPEKLEVLTAPDSIAVQVVGRDADPDTSSRLANAAAAAFVVELNRPGPGVGAFALQDRADIPDEPVGGAVSLPVALAGGAVAGGLLGAAVIVLLLASRRPVVSSSDAVQVTGIPAFGLVELPRLASGEFPGPRGIVGVATVTRGVLETAPNALLVTSPPDAAAARRRISVMLAVSLDAFRSVETRMLPEMDDAVATHRSRSHSPTRAETRGTGGTPLLIVDGAEPGDVMDYEDYSRCTLLVVRQGMTSRRLRRLVSQYLEGELDGVVLYRTTRRRSPRGAAIAADGKAAESAAAAEAPQGEALLRVPHK